VTAGLLAAFLGVLLVDSALRGVAPWSPLVEAFGGSPIPAQKTPKVPGADTVDVQGPTPSGAPAGGNPRVQAFARAVFAAYPNAHNAGVYACRKIIPHDGGTSNVWSEHSWSNAIDISADAQTMHKIVVWANLNRNRFHINNVIGPGSAVNVVHVDFLPSHAGQVPACAGGKAA
jgi:hypothetical protein